MMALEVYVDSQWRRPCKTPEYFGRLWILDPGWPSNAEVSKPSADKPEAALEIQIREF